MSRVADLLKDSYNYFPNARLDLYMSKILFSNLVKKDKFYSEGPTKRPHEAQGSSKTISYNSPGEQEFIL